MKVLGLILLSLVALVPGMTVGWMILGAPGSHALDGGFEPSLWLDADERGVDPGAP